MTSAPTATEACGHTLREALRTGDYSHITGEWTLDTMLHEPATAPLSAALWYASQGIPVFPCKTDKAPATRHGLNDATTDADQIQTWWAENPAANVAMRTGVKYDVLDIDGPPGHRAILRRPDLLDQLATIPVHAVVYTPRPGGVHYWLPAGLPSGVIDDCLDYKGAGGYVLLPPSYVAERDKGYRGFYRFAHNPTAGTVSLPHLEARA
jgi:hypothetical protein